MNNIQMVNKVLDARGLQCPLPIVKIKKIIEQMREGETLKVLATDPGSERDLNINCFLGGRLC